MTNVLLFCILGLGAGTLYAGLSIGVVLNFRGAGVVNLGLGGAATIGAYLFYGLVTGGYLFLPAIGGLPDRIPLGGPWPVPLAALASVGIVASFGAAFDRFAFRRLRRAPALSRLIATLGLLMIAQAIVTQRFGTGGLLAPSVLPVGSLKLGGVSVPTDRLMLGAGIAVVTLVLWVIYRYTTFGLQTRAASENEDGAALLGLSANRLSLVNTTLAFGIAAAVGILIAPISQLDPSVLSNAIVPALAAALLAGFVSFPIAMTAGLAMGMVQALVTYAQSFSWFPASDGLPLQGVPDLLFFLVVVVAMIFRGKSLPVRGVSLEQRLPKAPPPERILRPGLIALTVGIVALLVLPSSARQAMIFTSIALIVCLSLVVLVGYAGQLSLVQTALSGVAGFAVAKLAAQAGIGFPWAPLIAIAITVLFGVLIALPALRIRGVHLAIVTMAAAVALNTFGFSNPTWGASSSGSPVPAPKLGGVAVGPGAGWFFGYSSLPTPIFGLLCLVIAVLLTMATASLRRSQFGQAMLATRSNERAAAASGIAVNGVKICAFALAAGLSGVAGVLYAYNYGAVSASSYTLPMGLTFISFVLMFGVGSVSGAVAAATSAVEGVVVYAVNHVVTFSSDFQLLLGGVGLILTVVFNPDGVTVQKPKSAGGDSRAKALLTRLWRKSAIKQQPDAVVSADVGSSAAAMTGSAPDRPHALRGAGLTRGERRS